MKTENKNILQKLSLNRNLKFNNFFMNKFLGFLFRKGKKYILIKIFNSILFDFKKKYLVSFSILFYRIIFQIKTQLKIIMKRKGAALFLIPFPLKDLRKVFLPLKELTREFFLINQHKFKDKLMQGLYTIILKKRAAILKVKISDYYSSVENRMLLHYRWGY